MGQVNMSSLEKLPENAHILGGWVTFALKRPDSRAQLRYSYACALREQNEATQVPGKARLPAKKAENTGHQQGWGTGERGCPVGKEP